MANVYLVTDHRTAGEWHTSKSDKNQYCGSCEEVFAFNKEKGLPSIWTICQARKVLLVVVKTLAAYRRSLAEKWAHLFTDETNR